jgi:hypothetical protein
MDHNMVVSYGCDKQWNRQQQKCRQIAGGFDSHVDAAVQCVAHRPMAHIQGFTWSHWMPLLGKCPRRIAPAAAKVINFGCKHKNTNKTQFLAS